MRGWLLKHGVARSPGGTTKPPSVAGRVLPARGGPAAEAVATVGTAMRCGLIPVTCLFFFFVCLGRDIHYTSAMITTSRACEVHSKPERQRLTTHLEFVQALILKGTAMKTKQATAKPKLVT